MEEGYPESEVRKKIVRFSHYIGKKYKEHQVRAKEHQVQAQIREKQEAIEARIDTSTFILDKEVGNEAISIASQKKLRPGLWVEAITARYNIARIQLETCQKNIEDSSKSLQEYRQRIINNTLLQDYKNILEIHQYSLSISYDEVKTLQLELTQKVNLAKKHNKEIYEKRNENILRSGRAAGFAFDKGNNALGAVIIVGAIVYNLAKIPETRRKAQKYQGEVDLFVEEVYGVLHLIKSIKLKIGTLHNMHEKSEELLNTYINRYKELTDRYVITIEEVKSFGILKKLLTSPEEIKKNQEQVEYYKLQKKINREKFISSTRNSEDRIEIEQIVKNINISGQQLEQLIVVELA